MGPQEPSASNDSTNRYGYEPPLSQLFGLGERPLRRPQPLDYLALGINESHLAELAEMSRDEVLNELPEDTAEAYAPLHAMRAMIQMGTEATIDPLARLLEYDETADYDELDDWFLEEIPEAFGKMGGAAVPRCVALLRDRSKHLYSRLAAAISLGKIGEGHPDFRGECVGALVEQLQAFNENDPEWNGWLVAELSNLKAVEAAPLIQQAFAADIVDETIIGDWDEVQAKLGLRPPLSDEELAEKARKRHAAHGWITPEEMFADEEDEELLEEMAAGWDDSGDEAWDRLSGDDAADLDRPQMVMPEDMYSADERRQLAKQRQKQRKAQERIRARLKQNKKRH